MTISVIEFNDPLNFTYDSNKVEFVDNTLQQKSQVLSSELCFFNFDTNGDLSSKRGSTAIVLPDYNGANLNTAQITGGKLQFFGTNYSRAYLPNTMFSGTKGTISFKFKPNFNTVATDQTILHILNPASPSTHFLKLYIQNQGGGVSRVRLQITGAGVILADTVLNTPTFVSGTEYDLRLYYDFTTGAIRFFFDGSLVYSGTGSISTFTVSSSHQVSFGGVYPNQPNFQLDDIQIFNDLIDLTYSNFTVPVAEPTTYDDEWSLIRCNFTIPVTEITSFDSIFEDDVKFRIRVGGDPKYWNGSNWVSSGALSQANTASEINTNVSSLINSNSYVQLDIVVKSSTGYIQSYVDFLALAFNFYYESQYPNLCLIYGSILDMGGEPVAGAKISIDSTDLNNGINFYTKVKDVYTDDLGAFEIYCVETETISKTVDITIEYKQDGKTKKTKYSGVEVPNQPVASLSDII